MPRPTPTICSWRSWRGECRSRTKSERYCSTTLEEIAELAPEIILLPSEPYPFTSKHFVHLNPLAKMPAGKGGHFDLNPWHGAVLVRTKHWRRADGAISPIHLRAGDDRFLASC